MDDKNQRQAEKRTYVVLVSFILAFVVICALSSVLIVRALRGEREEPIPVLPGAEVSVFVRLAGKRAYPEAVTLGPDGNLYSGSFCTGEIWRISLDGELETWIQAGSGIGSVSGMVFDSEGVLYVVDHGDCNPRNSTTSLKTIQPDGTVASYYAGGENEILNGLAIGPNGLLYATDTQAGEVLVFREPGSPEVWWSHADDTVEAQLTGIAYDASRDAMIVADSSSGTISRINFAADGSAGEVTVLYEDSQRALDGLTLDDEGGIIFTIFDTGAIARLNEEGNMEILAENFREPSDVAYLDGRVYVTNFDSISLAPVISILLSPSLPFTIDVIDLTAVQR